MKHKRTKFGQATTGRLLAVASMLCLNANGASAQSDHKTLFFISNSHHDTRVSRTLPGTLQMVMDRLWSMLSVVSASQW